LFQNVHATSKRRLGKAIAMTEELQYQRSMLFLKGALGYLSAAGGAGILNYDLLF
jgi:hypothetical protein